MKHFEHYREMPVQWTKTTRALVTSGFTLGGGLVTFLGGQIFLKFLEGALELRSIIAEIDCDLTVYIVDRSIASSQDRYRIFRRHSGRLQAAAWKVIAYSCFEDLLHLPPREDVLQAATELLELAIWDAESDKYPTETQHALQSEKHIRELLRLKQRLIRMTWVKGD